MCLIYSYRQQVEVIKNSPPITNALQGYDPQARRWRNSQNDA